MRKVQDEEEDVRGVDESREAKFEGAVATTGRKEENTRGSSRERVDSSDDEQEGQEETAQEREEGKVQEEERLRKESE